MTLQHLISGEVVNLRSLKGNMPTDSSFALVKTPEMEVIRMVLSSGKRIPEHKVSGKISVQCLEGHTTFIVSGEPRELRENDWLFLNGDEPHSLEAKADSVLLVTLLFAPSC